MHRKQFFFQGAVLLFSLSLLFGGATSTYAEDWPTQSFPLQLQLEQGNPTMGKTQNLILTNLAVSFVIGNIVAWSMGAWPIDFPKKAYDAEDQAIIEEIQQELQENPGDPELMMELGSIYTLHNDLEIADENLSKARELNMENFETLSWYSANKLKQAGAMLDFSMGLWKLYRIGEATDGLEQAVQGDPENLSTRLNHLLAIANLGTLTSHFPEVFDDEKWFLQYLQEDPSYFPTDVTNHFYLGMATAYLEQTKEAENDQQKQDYIKKAEEYLQKIRSASNLNDEHKEILANVEQRFSKTKEG